MKMKPKAMAFLAGAGLLLLVGCDEEKYSLRFSHYIHVEDNGMDCDECHGEVGQPAFTAITHASCSDCHDEVEAEKVSQETCGYCHEEKQLPHLDMERLFALMAEDSEKESSEPAVNVFVHTDALAGKCNDCHGALLDEKLAVVPELTRNDIVRLRDAAHDSGQDCLMCHINMDRNLEPANHDHAWMRRHGQLGMQFDAACSVCHTEDSCTECHSVMTPVSHNNLFRMRTHGVEAGWDRASCAVCHEEDSCQSCHSQTRPISHNARWGAPGYKPTHCIGCHDTSTAGDGCVTCHEGGNDVTLHEQYWGGASFNHDILTTESCYICHWSKTP